VCYHKRDFIPGRTTLMNIGDAIVHSKRTVCYVTENFSLSDWCVWEFESALNLDLTNKRHRLIVILDSVEPSLIAHHSLRTYLQRFTYLEHNSEYFAENLVYSLPMHKLGSNDLNTASGVSNGTCDDHTALLG
jgi:hypothetical protein